jgi:hypothetical protein
VGVTGTIETISSWDAVNSEDSVGKFSHFFLKKKKEKKEYGVLQEEGSTLLHSQ